MSSVDKTNMSSGDKATVEPKKMETEDVSGAEPGENDDSAMEGVEKDPLSVDNATEEMEFVEDEEGTMREMADDEPSLNINLGKKCRGVRAKYMKLISDDGFCFYIEKSLALSAPKIREMYVEKKEKTQPFINILRFSGIKGRALESVCKYLHYRARYEGSLHRFDIYRQFPEFEIQPEESLECFLAACFFKI